MFSFRSATLATLAWGAFSGASQQWWGMVLLLTGCAGIGLVGLGSSRARREHTISKSLFAAVIATTACALLQLVPLPPAIVDRVSPANHTLVPERPVVSSTAQNESTADKASRRAVGEGEWRPLSVQPASTFRGLLCAVSLTLFFLGTTARLSPSDVQWLAGGIIVLGGLLAVTAILQLLNLLPLLPHGSSFGPFPNKNHYAAWMLMAIPLALGYVCAPWIVSRPVVDAGHGRSVLRRRVTALGRPATLVLALLAMGITLVLTMSRSGIGCFAAVLILTGIWVTRRQAFRLHRVVTIALLAVFALVSAVSAGTGALVDRFAALKGSELSARAPIWRHTLRILRDFPLTGAGLNTYGFATLMYRANDDARARATASQGTPQELSAASFLAAHNDYLQLAAEGGLLLGVPVAVLLVVFVGTVRQRVRADPPEALTAWVRAGAVTGVIAVGLQELVEFSLQVPANAAFFALLGAIAIHGTQTAEPVSSEARGVQP